MCMSGSDLSTVVVIGSIHLVFHADNQPEDDALGDYTIFGAPSFSDLGFCMAR